MPREVGNRRSILPQNTPRQISCIPGLFGNPFYLVSLQADPAPPFVSFVLRRFSMQQNKLCGQLIPSSHLNRCLTCRLIGCVELKIMGGKKNGILRYVFKPYLREIRKTIIVRKCSKFVAIVCSITNFGMITLWALFKGIRILS